MRYSQAQILTIFEKANATPFYPEGCTQQQLRELDARNYRVGYIQWMFNDILGRQEDPVYQKLQARFPLEADSIILGIANFDDDRKDGNGARYAGYERALGYYPWGNDFRPSDAHHFSSLLPPPPPPPPPVLTPEQEAEAAIKKEETRANVRERVRRFRARQREAALQEASDKKLADQQERREGFANEFAVNDVAEGHYPLQ